MKKMIVNNVMKITGKYHQEKNKKQIIAFQNKMI